MKLVKIGILSLYGLLSVVDLAGAQSLTDSLQSERMTVVKVDMAAGEIVWINGHPDGRVAHKVNGRTLVINEGQRVDLGSLNPGDIVKAKIRAGRLQKITVLRPASAEIASPER